MPRVTAGATIDIHFQSPHEMVACLSGTIQSGRLVLPSGPRLPAGEQRPVVIHVPWLGRSIRVQGVVLRVDDPAADPPALHMRLLDDPRGSLDQLRDAVGRFRSGALLEEGSPAPSPGGAELSAEQRIRAMSPSLRVMLAARADGEERTILGRDADPRIVEYLLKNPGITLEEVRRLAARLNLHQGHFATILRNPSWMGDEQLRTILARNPRLPEFMADQVLQTLPTPALKGMAESINTTASTRRAAVRVLLSRGVVVSARRGY